MPKIQLSIKTTYLSSWGAYEGIRELVQNGRDSDVEGHALTVDWYKNTLRIENEGAVLPTKALLLGHTTKEGRSDQIGKFGEGLKLGVLALVRAGHPVKIRNGSEVWVPSLERSETFDEDVLTFRIDGGNADKKRVRIEVGDIPKEVWEQMKSCFLFLDKPKAEEVVATSYGKLLTNPKHRGKVYVKGIFVQTEANLQWGYDLDDAELDRDRKMVQGFDLRYNTKNILLLAINKRPDLLAGFVSVLEEPTVEVQDLTDSNSAYHLSADTAKFVAEDFKQKYGENAFPVQSLSESKDLEHLGKKGVVVNKQLGTVLAKTLGDAMTAKESLKKEVLKKYGWGDLNDAERRSLESAIELVNHVEPVTLDNVDVVDFRSETLLGQFKEGRCLLAKKHLEDADETLATLIHELAHRHGGDGEHSHVACMESIWKGVARYLRQKAGV